MNFAARLSGVCSGDQVLVLRGGPDVYLGPLVCFGPMLGQFDAGRQLLQLPSVRGGAEPFRVGREQHLNAVAELIHDERGVHPRHQAHACVGVAGVV